MFVSVHKIIYVTLSAVVLSVNIKIKICSELGMMNQSG